MKALTLITGLTAAALLGACTTVYEKPVAAAPAPTVAYVTPTPTYVTPTYVAPAPATVVVH